jgi:hypothetical protein
LRDDDLLHKGLKIGKGFARGKCQKPAHRRHSVPQTSVGRHDADSGLPEVRADHFALGAAAVALLEPGSRFSHPDRAATFPRATSSGPGRTTAGPDVPAPESVWDHECVANCDSARDAAARL